MGVLIPDEPVVGEQLYGCFDESVEVESVVALEPAPVLVLDLFVLRVVEAPQNILRLGLLLVQVLCALNQFFFSVP